MSRWFRWYEGTSEDGKFRLVARLSRVTVRDVIALWAFMLEDAAHLDHRGICKRNEDFMTSVLDFEDGVVERILCEMEAAGIISVGHGAISICNWDKRQFESDADRTAARRQREHRERTKKVQPVTHAHVTRDKGGSDTDTDTDTEKKEDARSALQKRVGAFRQAIVSAYAEANSPSTPDTSRAELWVTQGYQEDICLAVIAGIVPRKPNVGLSYFDGPIAEAHTKKAPPRKSVTGPPPLDWDAVFTSYKKFGHWSRDAGNDPTSPNCRAPPEFLRKYGFEVQAA